MPTERSEDEPLWTEKRLAAHWDVSVRTIQRMRATGDGPAYVKIGKQVRYRPRIVRQYEQDKARRSTSDDYVGRPLRRPPPETHMGIGTVCASSLRP